MTFFATLSRAAGERGLPFMVIGGHAINASGYSRATADVDLLVRKNEADAWGQLFADLGYGVFHRGATFLQLTPPERMAAWPADLMFVSQETFDAMLAQARPVEMEGAQVRVPSMEHLLALKLHALKTGGPERQARDLLDVMGLLRAGNLDPDGESVRELFVKYGTMEWYERAIQGLRS